MKDVISAVDKFISFFCATCNSADVIEVLALLVHGFRRIATIATVDVVHGRMVGCVVRLIDMPFYLVDEGAARGRSGDILFSFAK